MNLVIVAIRDSAVDAYMRPMAVRATGEAVRMFGDEINRRAEDNGLYHHPDDFELWLIAEFDDRQGEVLLTERRLLARGKDVKQGDKQ